MKKIFSVYFYTLSAPSCQVGTLSPSSYSFYLYSFYLCNMYYYSSLFFYTRSLDLLIIAICIHYFSIRVSFYLRVRLRQISLFSLSGHNTLHYDENPDLWGYIQKSQNIKCSPLCLPYFKYDFLNVKSINCEKLDTNGSKCIPIFISLQRASNFHHLNFLLKVILGFPIVFPYKLWPFSFLCLHSNFNFITSFSAALLFSYLKVLIFGYLSCLLTTTFLTINVLDKRVTHWLLLHTSVPLSTPLLNSIYFDHIWAKSSMKLALK